MFCWGSPKKRKAQPYVLFRQSKPPNNIYQLGVTRTLGSSKTHGKNDYAQIRFHACSKIDIYVRSKPLRFPLFGLSDGTVSRKYADVLGRRLEHLVATFGCSGG